MDKEEALTIAKRYVQTISKQFIVEKAILFGSFAKGTNHIDSDIDVAIVIKNISDIIDTQIELMKLRGDDDLRIEPHPFNEMDFNISNPAVNEILKNGIEIKAT